MIAFGIGWILTSIVLGFGLGRMIAIADERDRVFQDRAGSPRPPSTPFFCVDL